MRQAEQPAWNIWSADAAALAKGTYASRVCITTSVQEILVISRVCACQVQMYRPSQMQEAGRGRLVMLASEQHSQPQQAPHLTVPGSRG